MKRTKRVFSSAFKAEVALEAIKGVKTLSELAQEYELQPCTDHPVEEAILRSKRLGIRD